MSDVVLNPVGLPELGGISDSRIKWDGLGCSGFSIRAGVILLAGTQRRGATLRQEESSSARNLAGWRVVYPSPHFLPDALARIDEWVERNEVKSPLWIASIAMVAVATLHPLTDGNGRLSRMLFNALLWKHGMSRACYVPLSEIFASCTGGKELREKTGYYRNDWNPFMSYMIDAMNVATLH